MAMAAIASPAWTGDTMTNVEPLIHFAKADANEWYVINDGVMGGLSRSRITKTEDGTGLFSGTVSLENNGGFASIRTAVAKKSLAGHQGLEIRVRGDGRTYDLRLRLNDRIDGIAYRAAFETRAGEWTTTRVLFQEFEPSFRGRIVRDASPLIPENIQQIGFLLADKKPGAFSLEIDFVRGIPREDEGA
jgi:monofunctional biosynthetic peptidoglycan transglycosylase